MTVMYIVSSLAHRKVLGKWDESFGAMIETRKMREDVKDKETIYSFFGKSCQLLLIAAIQMSMCLPVEN